MVQKIFLIIIKKLTDRLQEIAGCVQSPNLIIPGKRIAAAWLTDLLENDSGELPIEADGSIRIPIQPLVGHE